MSEKKTEANRKNALKSTGPRTHEGKKKTSLNALKHGMRAASLAVPVLEAPEDWEAHRDQTVRSLAPVGYLENIMADRVAALLWRLGRVVRYESLHVSSEMEDVVEDYMGGNSLTIRTNPIHPDDLRLAADVAEKDLDLVSRLSSMKAGEKLEPTAAWGLVEDAAEEVEFALTEPDPEDEDRVLFTVSLDEVPDEADVEEWDGWTAGLLRKVLARVAEKAETTPEGLLHLVHLRRIRENGTAQGKARAAERELERSRRERLLPSGPVMDKVNRYETTLERSLFKTLHELQRLQAARMGNALPPPAALDLDVTGVS